MSRYYKIIVYNKRGDQPVYTYPGMGQVKQSKVNEFIFNIAQDVYRHETRSGLAGYKYRRGLGCIVQVDMCRFIVKAWPIKGGSNVQR